MRDKHLSLAIVFLGLCILCSAWIISRPNTSNVGITTKYSSKYLIEINDNGWGTILNQETGEIWTVANYGSSLYKREHTLNDE